MTTDKPRPVPVSERAVKNHLYGCHVDMDLGAPGQQGDCVIDYDAPSDCFHAENRRTKWTCPFWRLRSDAERI